MFFLSVHTLSELIPLVPFFSSTFQQREKCQILPAIAPQIINQVCTENGFSSQSLIVLCYEIYSVLSMMVFITNSSNRLMLETFFIQTVSVRKEPAQTFTLCLKQPMPCCQAPHVSCSVQHHALACLQPSHLFRFSSLELRLSVTSHYDLLHY